MVQAAATVTADVASSFILLPQHSDQSCILFSITVELSEKIAIFCNSAGETEPQIPPFWDPCKQISN